MMTVRFPNGQAVRYNSATFLKQWNVGSGQCAMYTQENGDLIAIVPADCIVEWHTPCRVENPIDGATPEKALELLLSQVENVDWGHRHSLIELKKKLQRFDSRTRQWRPL